MGKKANGEVMFVLELKNSSKTRNSKRLFISFLIFIPIVVCFTALMTRYFFDNRESDAICNNLLQADHLHSKKECIDSNWPPEYIAHYFPLERTTIDNVRTGMQDFQELTVVESFACKQDRHPIILTYGLRPINSIFYGVRPNRPIYSEELVFYFCDDILFDIAYHN